MCHDGSMFGRRHALRFLWQFLRRPMATGAIAPSSRHLARTMVSGIGMREARTIAEFGGGTGSFTRLILAEAGPDARALIFEINPSLAALLRRNVPDADVIVDSAARLGHHLKQRSLKQVDCVVCGLPWASFPDALQNQLLAALAANLRAGGHFATFAYVHACWFPRARALKAKLDKLFSSVAASPVVWRNLPPAFVWRCIR